MAGLGDILTTALLLGCLLYPDTTAFEVTAPGDTLYRTTLFVDLCQSQSRQQLCGLLTELQYTECEVISQDCSPSASILVSFSQRAVSQQDVENHLLLKVQAGSYEGMVLNAFAVTDVDECSTGLNQCSRNGLCANSKGSYSCGCSFGFTSPPGQSVPDGTLCLERCNARSCSLDAECEDAITETSGVTCTCRAGTACSAAETAIAQWAVIVIAVIAALGALTGFALCSYAMYRLFCQKWSSVDSLDAHSIDGFKPRAVPASEYDRFTDLGSIGRHHGGYASTIDEEDEDYSMLRNDGLKYGAGTTGLMSSRLSVPSEHGDPTPIMHPTAAYQLDQPSTDRHSVLNLTSPQQPDYY